MTVQSLDVPWRKSAEQLASDPSAPVTQRLEELLDASGDRDRLEPLLTDVLAAEQTREYLRYPDHYDRTHKFKSEMDSPAMHFFREVFATLFPEVQLQTFPAPLFHGNFVAEATEALERDAAYVAPELLSKDFCDAIERGLHQVKFVGGCGREVLGHPDNLDLIDSNVCRAKNQQYVLEIPEVQRLAFDPTILSIVTTYLGCCPVLTQTGCWYSKPHNNDEASLSSAAQMFHRDKGFIAWLKVFIHLTNVDEDAGPHEVLAGTHRNCARDPNPHIRYSDEEMRAEFGDELFADHRRMTGPRGTVFFEDTTAYHRGTPVRANHRLMLQLEYACSPYFSSGLIFTPEGLTGETEALRKACPRIFVSFDQAAFNRKQSVIKRQAWQARTRKILSSAKRQALRMLRPSPSPPTPKNDS